MKILALIGVILFSGNFISSVLADTLSDRLAFSLNLPRLPSAGYTNQPLLRRDSDVRICALRVEFVPDTLSTTTGNGTFDYESADSIYYDPPPHDSLYFADYLQFLDFYWDEMSNGQLNLTWDVFPAGMDTAYRLPEQMWVYNWNSSDVQLERGLAELFRDAVQAAEGDPDIQWDQYDLVIIFHAGAGAEFDLGFTETPHDLPSAWMVKEDFDLQLDLPDGVEVDNHGTPYYVEGGLILPETETHDGVQIAMTGVIVSLFGHWLGLPPLYDREDGTPVVGKWSMMDRGFGNYFGLIPGELDAWSRSYMGWLDPIEVDPGAYTLSTRLNQDHPDAYKVPINTDEYYLMECRNRDPEKDSLVYVWDSSGRQMVLNEHYEVVEDMTDTGFRVPVRADNLDFDAPGSGILIWHVDESNISEIGLNGFNTFGGRRGLDLEEADGAQDIGREYPFLTPGWGTDYGIFEDAWFRENEAHYDANGRAATFNSTSFPDTRANSGGYTHITIDSISALDTVMTFRFKRDYNQTGFPITFNDVNEIEAFSVGNIQGDSNMEIIAFSDADTIYAIDSKGNVFDTLESPYFKQIYGVGSCQVVTDFDADGLDEVVFTAIGTDGTVRLLLIDEDISNDLVVNSIYDFNDAPPDVVHLLACGDEHAINLLVVTFENSLGLDKRNLVFRTFDNHLTQTSSKSFPDYEYVADIQESNFTYKPIPPAIYGSDESDTILVSDAIDASRNSVMLVLHNEDVLANFSIDGIIVNTSVADFDASGEQDILYLTGGDNYRILQDPLKDLNSRIKEYTSEILAANLLIPIDFDKDGSYEILTKYWDGNPILLESNGLICDAYPVSISPRPQAIDDNLEGIVAATNLTRNYYNKNVLLADLDNNGQFEILLNSSIDIRAWRADGSMYPGYPVTSEYSSRPVIFTNIDSDPAIEMVSINAAYEPYSNRVVNVQELPSPPGVTSTIWWGSQYRDSRNRNAIWEPAAPFTATPSDPILPLELCYNWPNPVRDGSTNIRYFLNRQANVNVDIYDLMGEKVASLVGDSEPGYHHEIPWNTNGVGRGAYFAIVKAEDNGTSESKRIKIAVIN
ncbi:hypothetical protein ACFLQV_00465 [Calditrichota bacterium]